MTTPLRFGTISPRSVFTTTDCSMPAFAHKEAVMEHFRLLDLQKRKFECVHCKVSITGDHTRRRLEHLLGKGTSVKSCTGKLDDEILKELTSYLKALDDALDNSNRKRARCKDAVDILSSPVKKQAKLDVNVTKMNKKQMDLDYARMVTIFPSC